LLLGEPAGGQLFGELGGQPRDDVPARGRRLETQRRVAGLRAQQHGGEKEQSHGNTRMLNSNPNLEIRSKPKVEVRERRGGGGFLPSDFVLASVSIFGFRVFPAVTAMAAPAG
jgi:hypothetical protein